MTAGEAEAYHRRQVRVLAEAGVDLITATTMTYVEEGVGIARAAKAAGVPAVVSFTVETDGRLRTGMALGEAIEACDAATGGYPAYYMVNCAHPTHFRDVLSGGAWLERIGGIRANASKMSHAELDEAPELDPGDPQELGQDYRGADGGAAAAPGARRLLRHRSPPHRGDQPCLRAPSPRGLSRGVRPATPADAADMARLVDLASEGMVRRFWAEMAEPGEDVFAVGARRAARDEGAFSWRNGWIAELGGVVAGLLVGYRIGDAPEPVDEAPAMVRGLCRARERGARELVRQRAGDLRAAPRLRRRRRRCCGRRARLAEGAALSLIVADGNATARRLYEGFGFVEAERRPIVHDGWESDSREWVLMLRPAG